MQDYEWMVDRRTKIQKLLLELYRLLESNRPKIEQNPAQRKVCGLMIGASFSLWRAAFLVQVKEIREWGNVLEAGEKFLERVIETNAISFSDEHNISKRNWVVGYYLNNARFRAKEAISRLIEEGSRCHSLPEHHKKMELGITDRDRQPKEVWDETYEAVEIVLRILRDSHVLT